MPQSHITSIKMPALKNQPSKNVAFFLRKKKNLQWIDLERASSESKTLKKFWKKKKKKPNNGVV